MIMKNIFAVIFLFLSISGSYAENYVIGKNFFDLFVPNKTINKAKQTIVSSQTASDGGTLILEYYPPSLDINEMPRAAVKSKISLCNIIYMVMDKNYILTEIGVAGGDASQETAVIAAVWAVNEMLDLPGFEDLRKALVIPKENSKAALKMLVGELDRLQNIDQMNRRYSIDGYFLPPPPPPPPPGM